MRAIRLSAVLCVAALVFEAVQAADTYGIDTGHSAFLFRIKHMNAGNFYGRFNSGTGSLTLDEADMTKSSIEIDIKAESVDTANEKRDQHLRNPDFFNAKQFPSITFKSTAVKKIDDANVEVTGQMTMLGVSKEVSGKFARIGLTDKLVGFEGTFNIKRSDFGMKGMMQNLGDDVQITVSIEAAKKK